MMTLLIIFRIGIPRDSVFHFSIKIMYIFLPIYFAHKSLFIIVVHCCLKKEILNMIASTFFSHNTKLQKYAYFQITVFTYYLQYISIVFSFALIFSPFFIVCNSFLTMYKFCGKYFRETPSLLNEATFNMHAIIYVTFILCQCCTVIETLHLF